MESFLTAFDDVPDPRASNALDVARRDTSKGSLWIKLKRAGWDDVFLLNLINQLARE